MDVQIQAFQYGIEIERRFIDQDSRGTDTEYRDGDFIVNYRDVGALVIRVFDPKLRKQLVFVPGTSDAP